MNKNKKMMVILISLIFTIFLLTGYFIVSSVVELKTFNGEINKLEKFDITKDNKMVIKTHGNYKKVEKSIKSYLYNCSKDYKSITNITNNKEFKKVLSAENYKKDGPEFNNSIQLINKLEKEYENNSKKLSACHSNKKLKDNIKNINKKDLSLYNEAMYNSDIITNLDKSLKKANKSKEHTKQVLDNTLEVINLLKSNKDKWEIKKNKIVFNDYKVYEKYNELIKRVK
ncbi:MAG: hypothetical protein IJF92_03270 [Bacilli bacterium]|nr:hypothetical protein [Bacilli bacterium]